MNFTLPKFVSLCHCDPTELITELDKKLNPKGKGHDYYWALRKAVTSYIEDEKEEAITDILNSPSKEDERRYNKAAYAVFLKRFGKKKKTLEIVNHSEIYPVPQHGIEISVSPWFSTIEGGVTHLHVVWPYSKPKLLQRNANIGNSVFEKSFTSSRYGNSQFCIMDLVGDKRFTNKTVSPKTEMAFDSVCASIRRESQKL